MLLLPAVPGQVRRRAATLQYLRAMKKKRSSCIHLLLISAAGVLTAGCDDSVRYTYNSREDCVREWGEEACRT